jgi:hypothetical protein
MKIKIETYNNKTNKNQNKKTTWGSGAIEFHS